ncbi:MAG: pilus assembly protein TadG-related protein [Paracoccaceae bacterium]
MIPKAFRKFAKQQDGALTAFELFLALSDVVVGGLAIDVANAMMARTQLQVAADAAAHAALYIREFEDSDTAKQAALDVINVNMPSGSFGSLLTIDDIQFGFWDSDTQAFQVDAASKDGVLVDISRLAAKNNSVGTYFLKFAGFGSWDVRRGSVFETYIPTCFREGFVAEDIVEIQTDNIYRSGFCIHSQTYVSVRSNNEFEGGTIVSMPYEDNIDLPADGFATNIGLSSALRSGSYQIRIISRVDDIIAGVMDSSSSYYRDYITSSTPIALNRNAKLDASEFTPGRIHTINCTSASQKTAIHSGTFLQNIVLVTNCQLRFGENVRLEDVVVAVDNTSDPSINGASGVQLGRNDNCGSGGGAQLVTTGSIFLPQYLKMYGGQMIAVGDIEFTSDADGIQGASVISGGRIDGTTDMDMAFCGGAGMESNFEAEYFRLAT